MLGPFQPCWKRHRYGLKRRSEKGRENSNKMSSLIREMVRKKGRGRGEGGWIKEGAAGGKKGSREGRGKKGRRRGRRGEVGESSPQTGVKSPKESTGEQDRFFTTILQLELGWFSPTLGLCIRGPWVSHVAQLVKNLPAMQGTWVWSLGWEDPLEKGKAIASSILAWRIPLTV